VRASYEFLPQYEAYIEARYEQRDFELAVDRSGFDRSSHGYRLRTGVEALLGNLIEGRIFVGYLSQQYVAPLEDVGGLDFGAALDWSVTPLTTLHLVAARTVNDTTFSGVSATDDQSVGFSIDHDLLRNLTLRANVSHTDIQFRGDSRSDKLTAGDIGADYVLNRHLTVGARYTREQRTSNAELQGFIDNTLRIGITGHI